MDDGSKMETTLPAAKVADLQAKPETTAEPAKPAAQPASQTEDEPDPAKPEAKPAPQEPAKPEPAKREKPKPIATLLQKKHNAEQERDAAIARTKELEDQLAKLSQQPASAATTDDIKALAEELGADPAILQKIVDVARKGFQAPQLPKEVQDLIAQNKAQSEQQAEEEAFKADLGRLQGTLKDELLAKPEVQQKLQELAYSEEKAPDGEPYYKKPLYELYMNFVKPEHEPGKPSAEPAQGGSKGSGKVLDFAEIAADPAKESEFARTASKEQFAKFHAWQLENQQEPLKKPGF